VYFGGGTPSLLAVEEISQIIHAMKGLFTVAADTELTVEANPDDITPEYVAALQTTDVNRFSIGVQSFRDDDLEYLGRIHSGAQAKQSVELLLKSGFSNLSVDLIYGVPTLDDKGWAENLEWLAERGIPHISAYALTVEPNTPLNTYIASGRMAAPAEEDAVRHFVQMMDFAGEKGYQHYEISNVCLPGFASRHNQSYWEGTHYLGLGPSAHSYNGVSRQWNCSLIREYSSAISSGHIPCETEILSMADHYNEFVMTGLRTCRGLDAGVLRSRFGEEMLDYFVAAAQEFIHSGWLAHRDETYMLTRKGNLFADRVAAGLFI
jgi:oxygen-independent coproporphyrinogen III oxidase